MPRHFSFTGYSFRRLNITFGEVTTGVMVVDPIMNERPSIDDNLFKGTRCNFFADCGWTRLGESLTGRLSLTVTGPFNPGKQTIARNQCECSLIGIMIKSFSKMSTFLVQDLTLEWRFSAALSLGSSSIGCFLFHQKIKQSPSENPSRWRIYLNNITFQGFWRVGMSAVDRKKRKGHDICFATQCPIAYGTRILDKSRWCCHSAIVPGSNNYNHRCSLEIRTKRTSVRLVLKAEVSLWLTL